MAPNRMAPKAIVGKVPRDFGGGAGRPRPAPADHMHPRNGTGPGSVDINLLATEFMGPTGASSSSVASTTAGRSLARPTSHWAQSFCTDSPPLKKMNGGRKLIVSEISDAAARVRMYLNPGQKGGWEAEPFLLEELALHPPLLRFCAGVEAFGQNTKAAAQVLAVVANYPGYDALKEDMATAYEALQLQVLEEDADYRFLRNMASTPLLVHQMKQLRQRRMSKLARVPTSATVLMDEYRKLQSAYIKCVNVEQAALNGMRAAEQRLADAKAQRLEQLRSIKGKLSLLQGITNTKLGADEVAQAREAHQSTPHLQQTCTVGCFLETLKMQKVGGAIQANISSFAEFDPSAAVTQLNAMTLRATKNVESVLAQLNSAISSKNDAAGCSPELNAPGGNAGDLPQGIAELIGVWETALQESVPNTDV
eukprot:jgi/Botrbrau1/13225/Bobra.9_1s0014.1